VTSWLHIDRAARVVRKGGVIAYPTEGVYGLGCLPEDWPAVERVLDIKRRSWRKGLLLIAADLEQIEPFVRLPRAARRAEILASWPGPVTWVLEATARTPPWLTGGRPTLGVRITDHPIGSALCERVGSPLVSTSANVGGRPPLRRLLTVRRSLADAVDYVLPGPLGGLAGATIIRDGRTGRVLRGAAG
jgi:L-threonylcarbamoyladenylate synthase